VTSFKYCVSPNLEFIRNKLRHEAQTTASEHYPRTDVGFLCAIISVRDHFLVAYEVQKITGC
jgi:hypothetical protein